MNNRLDQLIHKLKANHSIAFVSCYIPQLSKAEHDQRIQQLTTMIKLSQFPYSNVDGGYIENNQVIKDNSCFMICCDSSQTDQLFDFAGLVTSKFNQDSFLFIHNRSEHIFKIKDVENQFTSVYHKPFVIHNINEPTICC